VYLSNRGRSRASRTAPLALHRVDDAGVHAARDRQRARQWRNAAGTRVHSAGVRTGGPRAASDADVSSHTCHDASRARGRRPDHAGGCHVRLLPHREGDTQRLRLGGGRQCLHRVCHEPVLCGGPGVRAGLRVCAMQRIGGPSVLRGEERELRRRGRLSPAHLRDGVRDPGTRSGRPPCADPRRGVPADPLCRRCGWRQAVSPEGLRGRVLLWRLQRLLSALPSCLRRSHWERPATSCGTNRCSPSGGCWIPRVPARGRCGDGGPRRGARGSRHG
jgi:hypothetical protein